MDRHKKDNDFPDGLGQKCFRNAKEKLFCLKLQMKVCTVNNNTKMRLSQRRKDEHEQCDIPFKECMSK